MLQLAPEPPGASFETPFLTKWLLRMRAVGVSRRRLETVRSIVRGAVPEETTPQDERLSGRA